MGVLLIRRWNRPAAAFLLVAISLLGPSTAAATAQSAGFDLSIQDPTGAVVAAFTSADEDQEPSSEVVRGRRTTCRIEGGSPEALLRCVVDGAGLDFYRLSSGTYVVISGPEGVPAYGSLAGLALLAIAWAPSLAATVRTTRAETAR